MYDCINLQIDVSQETGERCKMDKYVIRGGRPLQGQISISGAKNAAVAIIPAVLLVEGVCRLENIPQISDVRGDRLHGRAFCRCAV